MPPEPDAAAAGSRDATSARSESAPAPGLGAKHGGLHAPSLIQIFPSENLYDVSRGRTVLIVGRDGMIAEPSEGLLVFETRVLSRHRLLVDGSAPHPLTHSKVEQHSWLGYFTRVPPGNDADEPAGGSGMVRTMSQHTLEVRVSRSVGEGMHEDIDLVNHTQQETAFDLDLELEADFADLDEMGQPRQQTGRLERTWTDRADGGRLTFTYTAEHAYAHQGHRGTAHVTRATEVEIQHAGSTPELREGGLRFRVRLAPHGGWHACLVVSAVIDGRRCEPSGGCYDLERPGGEYGRRAAIFLESASGFSTRESPTLAPVVMATIERARRDLAALRLYDLDHSDRAWTVAAGVPLYVALFGRDTLTAGWQSSIVDTATLRGALVELARWQGERVDDWRDEQPNRMLHESHAGPLEALMFNPRARYYGSVTTSAFYPFALAQAWHWTGDRDFVWRCLGPARRALDWLDRYGDLDGDGLYEYQTHSTQGIKNQSWKDSGDAIVYEDGSQVPAPIASVEEQSFAYGAKTFMSELLWWMGRPDEAKRLFREANELKKRFNDAFWLEDDGYCAMALDPQKRRVRSVASDPGHALSSGILAGSRVRAVADRLLAPDLFSGWGVRTLSSEHPAYNPFSYHRGSVWPVEQGTLSLGFWRYGLHEHVNRVARALFEAAALFRFYRLPEVFSGHRRDDLHPFPALYAQACSPQAWSASAVFVLLQAILGLYPYAPLHLLLLDPHLPDWLPSITLHGLRVGAAKVTIAFDRQADGRTTYDVRDLRGTLRVIRQPSPWSQTDGFAGRAYEALRSLV